MSRELQERTTPITPFPAADAFAGRRRLAWFLVLTSFTLFLALCISIPIAVNSYIQNSRQLLLTSVATNQGTVALMQATGESAALLSAEPPRDVAIGTELLTNASDTALLTVSSPENNQLLMRTQIYGNSRVQVQEASAPRFRISSAGEMLRLRISNGRIRVTIVERQDRPFTLAIETPQGMVELSAPGQFTIEVNNDDTLVNVLDGQARLSAASSPEIILDLAANQRGILEFNKPPAGPLKTERDLVQNGNFSADFSSWTKQSWNVELADQPTGETRLIELAGEKSLRFSRMGLGHADASVRQVLNRDVTDFKSLRLIISFRINTQSLGVCGTVGSECPRTIRLDYEDINGTNLTWEQGFYANGQIAPDTPDICVNCSPPYNPHKRVLPGRVYVEEIDFLSSLARQGFRPPRRLNSISLIAAGHTFETDIIDVALAGEE